MTDRTGSLADPSSGGPAPGGEHPGRRRWLDRTPLRTQLAVILVVLSALVLIISGVVATAQLRSYLFAQLDDRLQATLSQVERSIDLGDEFGPGFGGGGPRDPDGSSNISVPFGYYADVLDADGNSVAVKNFDFGTDLPELPVLDSEAVETRGEKAFVVPSQDARESAWRVAVRSTADGTVVVATSVSDVSKAVRRLVLLLVVIGAGALVALAFVGSLVVRRSLRPLEEIESVAGDIAAGDLTRRVPDPDERTEVGRLAGALNGMLVQIESAVRDREAAASTANQSEQRMRRFVADASHELRTPLTSIRGFAELYRQGAVPDGPEVGRAMARIESEAGRMNILVEDMLLLARLDEKRPLQRAPVDMLPLAIDAVYDARAVAPDRVIELHAGSGPESMVLGDEARLRQVLGNIVTNALTHTPPGSPVQVQVGSAGDAVIVEVIDHGPGLDDEQAPRVFERFYRADPARSRAAGTSGAAAGSAPSAYAPGGALGGGHTGGTAGGSGLGLAIVAAITAAHGGRVEVDSTPGAGATFRVILPRAQSRHRDELAAGGGLVESGPVGSPAGDLSPLRAE